MSALRLRANRTLVEFLRRAAHRTLFLAFAGRRLILLVAILVRHLSSLLVAKRLQVITRGLLRVVRIRLHARACFSFRGCADCSANDAAMTWPEAPPLLLHSRGQRGYLACIPQIQQHGGGGG